MSYLERETVVTIASFDDVTATETLSKILSVFSARCTYESVNILPVHQNARQAGLPVKTVQAKVMKDGKETKEMVEQKQNVYTVEISTVKSGVWQTFSLLAEMKANGLVKDEMNYKITVRKEV